ncbi:MAG: M23 family metallopeptidase [Bdellovibrionaceae bacterium]|nr:M23 family metallopeptidase [Pseudobdellovibrionaceae bacterium]
MACLILSGLTLAPGEGMAFDWSFQVASQLNRKIETANRQVKNVNRPDEDCALCGETASGTATVARKHPPRTEARRQEPAIKLSAFSKYQPLITGGSCRISGRGFGMRHHPILKKTVYRHGRRVRIPMYRFHDGQDIPAARGTPIRAPMDGHIVSRGRRGGYGNAVTLKMANGISILVAHLSKYGRSGSVKKGEIIGYVGSTGLATGPHLHLTVISASGKKVDPKRVFSYKEMCNR